MYRRRRLNLIAMSAALIVPLATLALLVRSVRWADVILVHAGQRFGHVKSVAGSVHVMWVYVPGPSIVEFTQGRRAVEHDDYFRVEARAGWWRQEWFTFQRGRPIQWRAYGGPESRYTMLIVPHWFLALASALPALWFARRAWRDRRRWQRHQRGQCIACGYDLRGTPASCPECGRAAEAF